MNSVDEKIKQALDLHKKKEFFEAEKIYLEILSENPKDAQSLNLFGLLKFQIGDFNSAEELIKNALKIKECAYFYESLGRVLNAKKMDEQAINAYQKALRFDQNDFDIWFNLALTYKACNQFSESIDAYNQALKIKPNNPDVYFNLGNVYTNLNENQKALENYLKAAEFGLKDNVVDYFISDSYLKLKDFANGWKFYEKRPSREFGIMTQKLQYAKLLEQKPIYKGENLEGKTIFVYYEAAFGDTLMYARYIPFIKNLCKKVIFKPQSNLVKLFKDSDLQAEIIETFVDEAQLDFDYHIPLMSIPYALQLNKESEIPFAQGYLKADKNKVQEYKEKYFRTDKIKIGIKWKGNPAYDRNRIIPIEEFFPMLNLKEVQFYSLQKGEGIEELNKVPKEIPLINLGMEFETFADTAAAVENLDLVICNDTSVAHLVGAMGKPCYLMLPYVSNWRWHNDFSYSPWYSSIKIFKQDTLDNWQSAFNQAYQALIENYNL